MKQFSNYLLKLYRGALEKSAEEFRDWALNETKALIPFDSCVWGAGSWMAGQPRIHSIHLNNLDDGFMTSWIQHQHEDKLVRMAHMNINQTFNVDVTSEYSGTAIHEFHCKRFAMEHILGTATIDTDTRLFNTMSLYRSDPAIPFSETERALKEVIFPHLIEAAQKNWVANLHQLFPENQRSNFNSVATCDSLGILQIAMPAFIEICRLEWPEWRGPELPHAVHESMRSGALKFVGEEIVVCMSQLNDLLLLRARPKLAADELSLRELEVAQKFAAGADYKTIAQELCVSPSTIKGHLNKIYTKLGINEKASLVAEIRRMTH